MEDFKFQKLKKDHIYKVEVDYIGSANFYQYFVVIDIDTKSDSNMPVEVLNIYGYKKGHTNYWTLNEVFVECIGHRKDYPEYFI